ncbi:alanine racemase [Paenibacillus koleovorans]|uniref:alanine racemase n=1 Tax=Paenibacillus koleovorans TaxID=121608 RepID=UPI001FE84095|nr:alanine racemase [Paenibacillus koleovorans]
MDTFYRPTWVEVSLDALHHNVSSFRSLLPPEMAMLAVVKADGYGHGAVEVLREAFDAGASYAGVAFLDEAIELRHAGIQVPILVLGYTPPEAVTTALTHDITLTVFSREVLLAAEQAAAGAATAQTFENEAASLRSATTVPIASPSATSLPQQADAGQDDRRLGATQQHATLQQAAVQQQQPQQPQAPNKLKIHIKIDTGMGRLGLYDEDEATAFIEEAMQLPHVEVEGVYTHFASSDDSDKTYTRMQHRKFDRIISHFQQQGIRFPYIHTGNSAAAIDCPELSYNMVRIGLSMYGLYPSEEVLQDRIELQPAMSLVTRPVMIKTLPPDSGISYGTTYRTLGEERIATLPVGYADGYSRMLSGHVEVLVKGVRVPVVGRICMDQCMINVTDVSTEVTLEDEVVLFGTQGPVRLPVEEIADRLGTINYEVTCMISHRVPRVYTKNGEVFKVLNPLIR